MKPEDREAFLEIVIGFAELKGKQLSAPALELYWNAMQDWDLRDFQAAANHMIKSAPFMPTPKDFEDLRKAGRPTADEAWEIAYRHVKSGAYRHGLLGNPLIDHVVRMVNGYEYIAFYDIEKLHFLKKDFREAYEKTEDVDDIRNALPAITMKDLLALRPHDPQLEYTLPLRTEALRQATHGKPDPPALVVLRRA